MFHGAVKNSCRFIIKKGGDFVKYIWQISPLLDGSFLIINGTGWEVQASTINKNMSEAAAKAWRESVKNNKGIM